MGQTPIYGLRYVELPDPADANVLSRNLAEDVEEALKRVAGIPTNVPGSILLWPNSTLPAQGYGHWAWCDGASYATATYPDAAANIAGVWRTFGGLADPGAGNFRVPDLRGFALAGANPMPGGTKATSASRPTRTTTIGVSTGGEQITLTTAQLPQHNHGVTDPQHNHGAATGNDTPDHTHQIYAIWGGSSGDYRGLVDGDAQFMMNTYGRIEAHHHPINNGATGITIQNAGSGQTHENMQPTIFIPYIIFLG